jgi:glycerol-3-phosphate dehydrogenase
VELNTFDLIIVGAGINGAGIARDAAMRGLSVLLLDKGDIGSGTSSWSTRLIHGGLRYLEHGELALVWESLYEREVLLRIAPHLVRPLAITIPMYQDSSRSRIKIRAGMIAYDLLSLNKSLPRHHIYSARETLQHLPGLNPKGLLGSAKYYDAQVEFTERLVLENVLSAQSFGAQIITYAQVDRIVETSDKLLQVEYGTRKAIGRFVINCAGPWVDQLLQGAEGKPPRLIGGTKGSHLVIAPFKGAPESAIYLEARSDGRPLFIIPWNGNYLIGTTDIRFERDPDQVRCDESEIDYLLNETNRAFPAAQLNRSSVQYTYSGVRPLPYVDEADEADITRRHFIRTHPKFSNLLSIVGGKITTYRSLAEECVDQVFKQLERERVSCPTKTALPGAIGPAVKLDFPPRVSERLLRIYGTRSQEIAKLCEETPELDRVFNEQGDAIAAEIVFCFESELCQSLTDFLLRRTMLGLNVDLAIGNDEEAASIARQHLGWTIQRAEQEVKDYRDYLGRFGHG